MSGTDINKFLKQFEANQKLALKASADTINDAVGEMFKKIVERTPVGDPSLWNWPAHSDYTPGTLKESWNLSFNGQQRNTKGQFASGAQVLGSGGLSFRVGSASKIDVIINNPQPYAQRVETGWSTQAPTGMMRITVSEFPAMLNRAAAKNRTK